MATIVGVILKPDLTPFDGTVKFTAIATPMVSRYGSSVVAGSVVQVETDGDDGSFEVDLAAGRYRVKANAQWFLIDVPDGDAQYDIRELIAGGVWGATMEVGYTVQTPTASPDGGTFPSTVEITLESATTGASIRYTTDGSTPSDTVGTLYDTPFSVSETTTVKFIAYKTGATNSAVVTKTFTKELPVAATPTFDPNGGSFVVEEEVTIACTTPGATIHYTTDGSTPTGASPTYSTTITLSATTTVKAIAIAAGYQNSAVATAVFTATFPVYYGTSEDAILDEAGITGLESSVNASTEAGTYEFTVPASPEKYLYFAWRDSFGSPAVSTGFSAFGFPLGMATGGGYDQTQNGWSYALVSVGGVSYRLYRTEYKQGMNYTVIVS